VVPNDSLLTTDLHVKEIPYKLIVGPNGLIAIGISIALSIKLKGKYAHFAVILTCQQASLLNRWA
jgi:hypothetical protein